MPRILEDKPVVLKREATNFKSLTETERALRNRFKLTSSRICGRLVEVLDIFVLECIGETYLQLSALFSPCVLYLRS